MEFLLFLLLNVLLFVRPTDFIPVLMGMQLYLVVQVVCLVFTFHLVLEQLSARSLAERPISACVVGILIVAILSQVVRLNLQGAWNAANDLSKVVVYYLLIIGLVNTPERMRQLLQVVALSITVVLGLATLDFHGVVSLPNFNKFGYAGRLSATGLAEDPNDTCFLAVQGILIVLYLIEDRRSSIVVRAFWGGALLLNFHAFMQTQSRGGFVGLLAALITFLGVRYGGRRAILLGTVMLPLMFLISGGRQTDLDVSGSTGQARIHLWDNYISLFRANPVFGIGYKNSMNYSSHVAHNSYLSFYAELGFFGGTLLFGAFVLAVWSLRRVELDRVRASNPDLACWHAYLVASVASFGFLMISLSRGYAIPTYTVLGFTVVYLRLTEPYQTRPPLQWRTRVVAWLIVLSILFLFLTHLYVRSKANYY